MASEEAQNETIDIELIKKAIESLQDRGDDINPFSVAQEADVSGDVIIRDKMLMGLIVEARGGDFTFQPSSEGLQKDLNDANHRVDQLSNENNELINRIADLENRLEIFSEGDPEAVEQEKVKALEQELEETYSKLADAQEDNTDLGHSVTGLERVNQALNLRLRELEDEVRDLKAKSSAPEGGSEESPEQADRISQLEAELAQWIERTEKAEAKVTEFQEESESLAAQLQTTWNLVYQYQTAAQAAQAAAASAQAQVAAASGESTGETEAQPVGASRTPTTEMSPAPETVVYETTEDLPAAQEEAPAYHEAASAADEPVAAPVQAPAAESAEVLQALRDVNPEVYDPNYVYNFARPNPYVSSNYNPLENLSWRELETVYSMGVLSIKDFAKNIPDPRERQQQARPVQTQEEPVQAQEQPAYAAEHSEQPQHGDQQVAYAEEPEQQQEAPAQYSGEQSQYNDAQAGMEHPEIDFDQMDIFEDLEELEDLNSLDWPPEHQGALTGAAGGMEGMAYNRSDHSGQEELPEHGYQTYSMDTVDVNREQAAPAQGQEAAQGGEGKPVTGEELRKLIKSRIEQAKSKDYDANPLEAPLESHDVGGMPQEDDMPQKASMVNKFIGGKGGGQQPQQQVGSAQQRFIKTKHLPPDVRKYCMFLGIRPSDLTRELVQKEWKRQISDPRVHPDLGGDKELATDLNMAKDTLIKWLDDNEPKLGKKFGGGGAGSSGKEMSSRFTGRGRQGDKS